MTEFKIGDRVKYERTEAGVIVDLKQATGRWDQYIEGTEAWIYKGNLYLDRINTEILTHDDS